MECPSCKYEFCWLCLGDYKKHEAETGLFLCSTIDNVKKIGRYKAKDKKDILEARELQKVTHYTTMF